MKRERYMKEKLSVNFPKNAPVIKKKKVKSNAFLVSTTNENKTC